MLSGELGLPQFIPKGFPVAVWKLRDICANLRKTDVLPEESGVSKQPLSVKLGEEEAGAMDQSG